MTLINVIPETEAPVKVKAIYAEVKKVLGVPFVPNLFKALAVNPELLEATWNQFKTVMGTGELTRREKELVALAVSATNNCKYCILAHTAAAKGMGLSDKGVLELMAVVGLFNNFNKFLDGLQVEPDLGV